MIRYEEYFDRQLPEAYVKSANSTLRKLFNVASSPESLLTVNTNAIFAVSTSEVQTRSGVREVKTIAAFVTLVNFDGKPYIGWLVTSEQFRGHGIASTLIKLCQQRTSVLTLHEDSTNERLTNFYIRLGFHITGSRDVPNGIGGFLKQYYMEWRR